MKRTFLKILQVIAMFFLIIDTSVFAQTGQKGADFPAITNKHLAVIVIDFPDTPQSVKDKYFPSIVALRDTIFNGRIKNYLTDMSYGQFTLTGDVFGYFTYQTPGFVNGRVTEMEDVMKINTINIPGLDINKYDGFLFVPIYDAGLAIGWGGIPPFLLNGNLVNKPGFFVPINIGYWNRDFINYPNIVNTLNELEWYGIPISTDNGIEGTSIINYSKFDRTFSHELFHFMHVGHATSRTNGTSYDYEPEVSNNNCKCYSDSTLGSLLSLDYGNKFDIMGKSEYGMSLNMAFRDYFGWTDSNNRYSIKNYGHFTITISPLNILNGIRAVEIRVPFKYGNLNDFKNKGYFLEVRAANDKWDKMLLNPQLQGNNDGIMVIKTDGVNSELLDMSPSPNISYYGQIVADIRDIVLKPGMVYNNKEIKLSNVKKNADGSFSIDIDVFVPTTITAGGPTTLCQGNSVMLTSSSAISYLWSNGATTQNINVSTSGNYSVTVDNGSGSSSTSNILTVTVNPLPANAGSITGTPAVCQAQNSVTYTVPAITNATSYLWTLPTGATGTSTTNSITVNYGTSAISGNITVKGHNDCGDGAVSSLAITVNLLPANGGSITGTSTVCQGQNAVIYTVPAITNTTSYIWILPSGATGTSTTNSITVNYGTSAVSGNITVKGHNTCGDGMVSTLAITVNTLPSGAGIITGTSTVCQGQNSVIYTVPSIANASSYIWTMPTGATGISTTSSITVNYSTSAVSGNITVKGHNDCGDAVASTLPIVVNPIPITPIITQNGKVIHSDALTGNQWYNQNNPINGATGQDYTITAIGEYTVQVSLKGCVSALSNMIKDVVTSISSVENNDGIRIYPNPVSDDLTIEFNGNMNEIRYEVINAYGKLITSGVFRESTIVHTSSFSDGLYVIKFNTGKTCEFRKVIKQR